jgi:hypothetical protein
MRKNVAGQIICAQLLSSTTGAAVTSGTTTVYVLGDGGTQAEGAGTVTHEGNGCWSYAPAQAETDYSHVAFTFVNTSALTATVQVYTISYDPHDIGAAIWSAATRTLTSISDSSGVTTLLSRVTGAVLLAANYTAPPTANENADALLKRDWTAVTGEAARSALNALRFLRNKWSTSGGTLTVTKEDDSTSAWTSALSSSASADPITGSDPS